MDIIKIEENGLMTNDLIFAKVRPDAIIPSKNEEDAGYDIYANFEEDYMVIPSHTTKLIPTGIASAMCDKWYLNVAERGSTGSKGMKYSAGIIDSSYRGEIFIAISNVNDIDIVISKISDKEYTNMFGKQDEDGDLYLSEDVIFYPYTKAIAQLIVHEVPKMNIKEISYDELLKIPSKRGIGSLGSSNK